MRKLLVVFALVCTTTISVSARENADKILAEGKLLYRLEKASWYGTDAFLEMFPEKVKQIGGQLSYVDETGRAVNIFWRKDDSSKILARLFFESPMHTQPSVIDTLGSVVTPYEQALITIREDAKRLMAENEDHFFSFYENTSTNIIPLIADGRRNVFVVTAPREHGVVLLGNDYQLTYDKNNRLKKKEKLHNSLITLQSRSGNPEKPIAVTFHSHVLSDLITSTDICTLLLYRDFVEWRQHIVGGKKHVSIFDMNKEYIETVKTKVFMKTVEVREQDSNRR